MQDLDPNALRAAIERVTQLTRGFQSSYIVCAANGAGVFPLLEKGATADVVAQAAGWDPRATRMLLDALVALELAAKQDGSYRNTPLASATLVPGSPGYQGHIIEHVKYTAQRWARIEESLVSGSGVQQEMPKKSPEELRAFILGMNDIAKFSARELLDTLDLSKYTSFLDLGGGPATYDIALLERHPTMRATVFDLPDVIDIGREQVEQAGLSGRVTFLPGDMTQDTFGEGYDLVLLSNIIHSFDDGTNRRIVQKCHDAMLPGGLLIIKDFLVDNDRTGPPFSLLFAINMLVNTQAGDTYTFADVENWTRDAGFAGGRVLDLTPQTRMWLVEKA